MTNFKPGRINKSIFFLILILLLSINARAQAPNITYPTPQTYNVGNTIPTLSPTNTGGAVPPTIYGQVSTFAGSGAAGNTNAQGTAASFNNIYDLAADAAGNIYAAEYNNQWIRKITSTGMVSVLAGNGGTGSANGPANVATFDRPGGVTTDAAGNVYVGDQLNNQIRKITPAGVVSTFAGTGFDGGGNGPAGLATFSGPKGLAFDNAGNLYIAERNGNRIRKITPGGVVSTFAGSGAIGNTNGTGTAASFSGCADVATDQAGNVYVADRDNNLIRKITPAGVVTTLAGSGAQGGVNGTGTAASFYRPFDIDVDIEGNVYVADQFNHLIRKITPAGVVTTLAGNSSQSSVNGVGTAASFNYPTSSTLDGFGNLFVSEVGSNLIRKIILTGYTIDKALPTGLSFDQTTGIITGTPSIAWPATNYTVTAYNAGGSSITIVNIEVIAKIQSVITMPAPGANNPIDANNVLNTGATSNNNETPITFTSNNPAVAFIGIDGQVHVLAPGTVTITANQAGNNNYLAALPVQQTYIIKQTQVITFPPLSLKMTCEADFSSNVQSSNSTLPIIYSSSNPAVGTISSTGLIHILAAGTTTITASQPGNALFIDAAPQSRTLSITAPVVPSVTITPNYTTICAGQTVTYTAVINNTVINPSYQWQKNGLNVGTNAATYAGAVINTDVIRCVVTNNDICTASSPSNSISGIVIVPYVTPAITIQSSANGPVCVGTSITFTATPANAGTNPTYQWMINGNNAGASSTTFTTNTLSNNDQVTCRLTNNDTGVCLTSTTVTSTAVITNIITPATPLPSVTITASANNVYANTVITFNATPQNAGAISNIQWQINGVNTGPQAPVFTTSALTNNSRITCTITSTIPCTSPVTSNEILMNILPPPLVKIPNTFTPNGDGVNDKWDIPDLIFYPNCTIKIFNRYGAELFKSKGYDTPWDGTFNGKMLPASTYYYIIDLGDKAKSMAGYIAIIK